MNVFFYFRGLKRKSMPEKALSGLKVIEYGQSVSGPFCAKLLGDLGADVVKIEDETGDVARKKGPFPDNISHMEKSGLFLLANANKNGVVLDLKKKNDLNKFKELIRFCDIFIENRPPGTMKTFGADYNVLSKINPKLIMTSISPFGQFGPYRDYLANEFILYHMSGLGFGTPCNVSQPEVEYPLWAQASVVEFRAGLAGAVASVSALVDSLASKKGCHLDVSAMESAISTSMVDLVSYFYLDKELARVQSALVPGPAHIIPCKNGYVHLQCLEEYQWQNFLKAMKKPAWGNDEKFINGQNRFENWNELQLKIENTFSNHTKKELTSVLQSHKVPCTPLNTIKDLFDSKQFNERGFFIEKDHKAAGKLMYPAVIAKFSETPIQMVKTAPMLGEKNAEDILKKWKKSNIEKDKLDLLNTDIKQIRVLDFTSVLAGPLAAFYMAAIGAEVIKCESRDKKDMLRRLISDDSAFNFCNGGKKSVTINLLHSESSNLIKKLVMVSDVVIDNFPGKVAKKYGLDYESLKKIKPDIIAASCTGFGKTGPERNYIAYGRNLHAASGLSTIIGYSKQKPLGLSGQWSDTVSPLAVVYAICAALYHKAKTGKGQYIDVAMVEATAALIGEPIMDYVMNKKISDCGANRSVLSAPQGCYRCRGNDRWVAISISSQRNWEVFCKIIKKPDWITDNRYLTMQKRYVNHDELDKNIQKWTIKHTPEEITAILQKNKICAGPVIDSSKGLANDPHVKARGFFPRVDLFGEKKEILGIPWKSDNGNFVFKRAPLLGEHNKFVYNNLLRFSKKKYERLVREGII